MTVKGKNVDIIVDGEGDIETIEEQIDADDLPKAVQADRQEELPQGQDHQGREGHRRGQEGHLRGLHQGRRQGARGSPDVRRRQDHQGRREEGEGREDDEKEEKGKKKPKD